MKGYRFGKSEKTSASPLRIIRGKVKGSEESTQSMRMAGIKFESQVGREQIKPFGAYPNAHESRFSYASKPCKVLGTYHKTSSPNFSRTIARNSQRMYYSNMILNDYSLPQPAYLSSLHTGCILFYM